MEVGTRLAWLALRNDYGVDGVPLPAPTYKSMEKEYNDYHKCNQLVLSFNNLSGQNEFNESDSISVSPRTATTLREALRSPGRTRSGIRPKSTSAGGRIRLKSGRKMSPSL